MRLVPAPWRPDSDGRRRWAQAAVAGLDLLLAVALTVATAGLGSVGLDAGLLSGLVLAPVSLVVLAVAGRYEREFVVGASGLRKLEGLVLPSIAALWVSDLVLNAAPDIDFPWVQQLLLAGLLPVAWAFARTLVVRARRERERVVVVGTGQVAERVARLLERHGAGRAEVVGFVDDSPMGMPPGLPPVIGRLSALPSIIARRRIDRAIVAYVGEPDRHVLRVLREVDQAGVRLEVVPRLFDLMGSNVKTSTVGPLALISVHGSGHPVTSAVGKRLLDVVLSALALLAFAPTMAVVAVLVKLQDRGPVLFRQERIGRGGRRFGIYKFRTMVPDADQIAAERISGLSVAQAVAALKPGEDDPRVTRLGRFLRRSSLDELPQLFNVLKGDMSLVGPRPLVDWEVESLDDWQLHRHEVRPGITGHWQTMGRSGVGWEERMQMDFSYVRHWSLREDLRILARTFGATVRRAGAR